MLHKKFFLVLLGFMVISCRSKDALPASVVEAQTPQPPVATRIFASPIFVLSPTPTLSASLFDTPATPEFFASPTITPVPTFTFTPTATPTSIFYERGFDVPIGDYYKFIIHKAQNGERLEYFAEKYKTTVEAIMAINFHLTNPVWGSMLFVIPVNFSNVDGMPMFVVYQIKPEERGISVEGLAQKLRVDPFDLKYYNGMTAPGQRPLVGDLILVPWRPDQNRKIRIEESEQ